jgi:hypothetical protein
MSVRDIIETIATSPIWDKMSLSERIEAAVSIIKNLRSYNIIVEEDINIIDLVGEVYGGLR